MTVQSYPNLKYQYDHAGRPPIIEAADKTLEFYKENLACIGHDLPPRCGKAALIHILAIELCAAGAPFVHVLVPWTQLADQVTDSQKIEANLDRVVAKGYDSCFVSQKLDCIDHSRYWQRREGLDPVTLFGSTIHLGKHNIDVLERAATYVKETTGKRPVFIVDEAHLIGDGQSWWDMVMSLQRAGAFIVTMTGTSRRTDGSEIPGFKNIPLGEWHEKRQAVITKRGLPYRDPEGLLVRDITQEIRNGREQEYVTTASGVTVGWDRAFENRWMHPISAEPIDFDVLIDGGPVRMSSVDQTVARKNLGSWVRSRECCRALAAAGVKALSHYRRAKDGLRNAKMLIVTSADTNEAESNAHAREMRRQIQEHLSQDAFLSAQGLTVEICTSVTDDGQPDKKSLEKIAKFGLTCPDSKGRDPIDILIVKGMGIVGLDVPECKILIDAGTIRRGPMKYQLSTRNLTIWTVDGELAPEATTLYPCDPENKEHYESLTATSKAAKKQEWEDVLEIDKTVEVKPQDPPALIVDESGQKLGYQDEAGKWIDGDYDDLIRKINHRWPHTYSLRKIALIELYKGGAFPDAEMQKAEPVEITEGSCQKRRVRSLSEERKDERSFGEKARLMTNKYAGSIGIFYEQDPDRWKAFLTTLQSLAKDYCRISSHEPVTRIQDPELIGQLNDALEIVIPRVMEAFNHA